MKVGILGGTFNPIHNGHLYMGENALTELGLDQVIYIPSGVSYMKNPDEILEGEIRLKMVELALEYNQSFSSSDMEIKRCGPSYSVDTISQIKESNPDWDIYFLVGADTAYTILSWYKTAELLSLCHLVVVYREGQSVEELEQQCNILRERFLADVILLSAPGICVSSTRIRQLIKDKQDVSEYLPEAVVKYIIQNNLYR